MKKILIIEDEVPLREELALLLNNNGYAAVILTDFEDPVSAILQKDPDLVLMDIVMPGLNGQYLLKQLRAHSNVPVIMVTSKNTEMDEMLSLSYGADDYLTKPYHPQLLLLHIEALFKRMGQQPNTMDYRHVHINLERSSLESEQMELVLSKNEMGIFYFLYQHRGTIVSRDEIMDYLWSTERFIDDNTLTVNMNRLRRKLADIGLNEVIETRRGQGYLLK